MRLQFTGRPGNGYTEFMVWNLLHVKAEYESVASKFRILSRILSEIVGADSVEAVGVGAIGVGAVGTNPDRSD